MAAEFVASSAIEVDADTDLNEADNTLIVYDAYAPAQNMDKPNDDKTDVDLKEDDAPLIGKLPDPDPIMWSGYIYKMSRHVKQLRLRHVVVSLKHATLSTYTDADDSNANATEQIALKHYRVDMLTDANILAELRGEIKAWDQFVLVPANANGNHPIFYFCASWGTEDGAENGKYVKAAVICAMTYRLASMALKEKNYSQAKEDLLLLARHQRR